MIRLFISSAVDRRLLADYLRYLGHEVNEAAVNAGIEPIARTSLVIADEAAAQRHGRAILDLKWRSGVGFLPILILLPQRSHSGRWIQAGFDDVLRQPITKEELKARLDVFLRFREQSEDYRRLFEDALIGIYRCAADGRVLIANPAFLKLLGVSSLDELAGGDGERWRLQPDSAAFMAQLATERVVTGQEVRWRRRDGSTLYGLENARAVYDEERLLYVEGTLEDISARKLIEAEREELLARERAARAEAEAASRLKDEFLATVSHELRTPLSAIVGWSHLLRTQPTAPEALAQGLEVIERQARAQATLIDDLLDVSRIITGNLRLDLAPVNPRTVIDAGIEAIRPAAEAKGVRVHEAVAPGTGNIIADAARLQQIVWNLLSNAVKFTPAGGEVTIRVERLDSHVRIAVSDTGDGISADFLPYVFDRFRQRDGKTTRRHGGLGLGLSIVRHLTELHGGTVEAHSAGEGRGATFTVTLPMIAVQRGAAAAEQIVLRSRADESLNQPPRLEGIKVLVVDDEADTLDVLKVTLLRSGAHVVSARNAAEALEMLDRERPDVLLSDIAMPGVDGYELIQRVRATGNDALRAAALTAYARPEDRARALAAGYDMHVPKPFEPFSVVSAVARLLGRWAE